MHPGTVSSDAMPEVPKGSRNTMAIQTRIQTRQTIQNVAYAVLCLVLALWGWYDYSIKIPGKEAAFAEYSAAEKVKSTAEEKVRTMPLTPDESAQYKAAVDTLGKYKEKPAEPAAYDRPVQLWLYIVGCGILGVPWFAWAQWQLSRSRYRLNDDGSFECGAGSFAHDAITGIDMDRWMSKSIAYVLIQDGRRIELDDFKYKGVEDIVAALAARFHPGQWTSDARPIGDPKSRDTKRAAEVAAAAGAGTDAAATESSAAGVGAPEAADRSSQA
ncbi:MAG: hypothetical protein ACOYMM_11865 [Phycisphaerales bacterium]